MRALAAALALFAAIQGAAARAGESGPSERPGPTITRIDLKGLRTVRPATVRRRMALVAGGAYRPELVLQDRDRLMETGHFDDVRFFPKAEGKGVALTVEFVEAPVVRAIRFEAPEGGPPRTHLRRRTMRAHLSFRKGDRLRRGVAGADAGVLAQTLRDAGYLDAAVRAEIRPVSEGEVEVVYRVADGRRLYVREIRIRGNRAISDRALLRAHFVPGVRVVESRTRGWLRGGRLTEDALRGDARRLQAYYRLLGYLDARVRLAPLERLIPTERRQPVRITFLVEEGERYRVGSIEIRGNRSLTSDTVRAFTSITPGGVYSERRLAADRGRIRDLFGRHGRAFTRVRTESRLGAEPNTMDVVYHIRESPVLRVGEVHIRGRTRTHDNVARREIELRPGEVYDSLNLERSRRNLMCSGLFDPQRLIPPPLRQ